MAVFLVVGVLFRLLFTGAWWQMLIITLSLKKQMPKNLQFLITLLLILFLTHGLHAAPLKNLSLDFTRKLTENEKTEHIVGILHYDVAKWQVTIEVTEPVKQIMVAKDNILEIYYPVEKQAFRFISDGSVPLVESILQATQAVYGLTALADERNRIRPSNLSCESMPLHNRVLERTRRKSITNNETGDLVLERLR